MQTDGTQLQHHSQLTFVVSVCVCVCALNIN